MLQQPLLLIPAWVSVTVLYICKLLAKVHLYFIFIYLFLWMLWREKIKKLNVVLTLSYLMDLWLCRKFCPSLKVRRSGGEEERFASGKCSCVVGCYWESLPTHWDKNNSLVSFNLWPIPGREKKYFIIYTPDIPHTVSLKSNFWIPLSSIGLFPVFMSSRLAINICCSPVWLGDDI